MVDEWRVRHRVVPLRRTEEQPRHVLQPRNPAGNVVELGRVGVCVVCAVRADNVPEAKRPAHANPVRKKEGKRKGGIRDEG